MGYLRPTCRSVLNSLIRMQAPFRAIGAILLLAGIGALLPVGSASAHIPTYGTSTSNNWGSVYPHGPTTYVQLMNSLRGYTNMTTDYNNARGHLNSQTDSGVAANPPFTDVLPGNTPTPKVLIVEAGSAEETYINAAVGFAACSSSTAWGKVYKMNDYGSGTHWHTLDQKICIWPSRFSRTTTNGGVPDVRYQYLNARARDGAHRQPG